MISSGLNRPDIGRFVGQLKEYLEFQKRLGRVFLPRPTKEGKKFGDLKPASQFNYNSLTALSEGIIRCQKCPLFQTRRQAVPGQGASGAPFDVYRRRPGV